jgi:hypothetical protein
MGSGRMRQGSLTLQDTGKGRVLKPHKQAQQESVVIVRKMISVSILGGIAAVALAGSASAQSATEIRLKALEKRQAVQEQSIADGRRDGSLTIWEKARLVREQKRVDKLEAEVSRDGKITRDEYYKVKDAQNDAGRHITSEKHDAQVRGWWWRTFAR